MTDATLHALTNDHSVVAKDTQGRTWIGTRAWLICRGVEPDVKIEALDRLATAPDDLVTLQYLSTVLGMGRQRREYRRPDGRTVHLDALVCEHIEHEWTWEDDDGKETVLILWRQAADAGPDPTYTPVYVMGDGETIDAEQVCAVVMPMTRPK